jgi:hypothetical protein
MSAVAATKQIMQLIEFATGLSINYHKTTFLPIHVPQAEADVLAAFSAPPPPPFPKLPLASL